MEKDIQNGGNCKGKSKSSKERFAGIRNALNLFGLVDRHRPPFLAEDGPPKSATALEKGLHCARGEVLMVNLVDR